VDSRISIPRRWRLVNQLTEELWIRWQHSYLQTLQACRKWFTPSNNLRVGDIVLLKDQSLGTIYWLMGLVERVFRGDDDTVSVVDFRYGG